MDHGFRLVALARELDEWSSECDQCGRGGEKRQWSLQDHAQVRPVLPRNAKSVPFFRLIYMYIHVSSHVLNYCHKSVESFLIYKKGLHSYKSMETIPTTWVLTITCIVEVFFDFICTYRQINCVNCFTYVEDVLTMFTCIIGVFHLYM